MPGDLIVYRSYPQEPWILAAVTHCHQTTVEVAPVCRRSKNERAKLAIFIDWSMNDRTAAATICFSLTDTDAVPIEADYEARIIEDRIINPHGEETEDCWYIDPVELSKWSITLPPVEED